MTTPISQNFFQKTTIGQNSTSASSPLAGPNNPKGLSVNNAYTQNYATMFNNPRLNNTQQTDSLIMSASYFQATPKEWNPSQKKTVNTQQGKNSDSSTQKQDTEIEDAVSSKDEADLDEEKEGKQ